MNAINDAIDGLPTDGATAADYGLQKAKELYDNTGAYEAVTTQTGRKKIVVFFTDGEPNHGSGFDSTVASDAITAANTLKAAPYNATVYSIGVFSGLSGSALTQVENYMKAVASPKPSPSTEKQYYPASDSTALNNIFDSISNEVGNIASATVTDEIDPRFELTAASRSVLIADPNVTIVGNTITWRNQPINVLKDDQGNLIPSWTKPFSIQAKAQFIGGNNIPTNVEATSGVAYGSSLFAEFPHPTVNVKAEFNVGNAENTIFNGEAVPTTTLGKYKVMGQDLFCGVGANGTFTYQWLKDGTIPIAATEAFPADSQFPVDGTSYTLRASFDPGNPTTASTANTDDHVAGETAIAPGVKGPVSATGQYTVHVVKGQLNLSKVITAKYPAPDSVQANQSFVFKIQRYATLADLNSQTNPETSYEVISLSGNTLNGNKTITGLKKGYYTVTEQTGDAWRYSQTGVADNDSSVGTTTDGIVNIGRETTVGVAVQKSYFGAGVNACGVAVNPATVGFTNRLDKHQWLGDTTVAVNTIRHAS